MPERGKMFCNNRTLNTNVCRKRNLAAINVLYAREARFIGCPRNVRCWSVAAARAIVRGAHYKERRLATNAVSNNERNESPGTDDGSVSPEPPDRPPGKVRQVHPEDKAQFLAYEPTYRKKAKPKSLPLEDNQMYSHLANTNVAMSPMYPLTPNICVEGGKIEFIKSPPGSARNSVALASPPQTPVVVRRSAREKREVRCSDDHVEKFDDDKELLEKRIKQLEAQVEEEKRRTQRERMAVTKLQNKLIKLKLNLGAFKIPEWDLITAEGLGRD
ncbi:unnamed protein product, partial [Iphiclides podalirius]